MEIDKQELVRVNVTTLRIHCKVSDRFCAALATSTGTEIFQQDDGYVPDFMPGSHYGDYVILDIDIDTGMVTNWTPPTKEQIQEWIKATEEE